MFVGWTHFVPKFNRPMRSLTPPAAFYLKEAKAHQRLQCYCCCWWWWCVLLNSGLSQNGVPDDCWWALLNKLVYVAILTKRSPAQTNLSKRGAFFFSDNEMFRLGDEERSGIVCSLHWNKSAPSVYEERKINNAIKIIKFIFAHFIVKKICLWNCRVPQNCRNSVPVLLSYGVCSWMVIKLETTMANQMYSTFGV